MVMTTKGSDAPEEKPVVSAEIDNTSRFVKPVPPYEPIPYELPSKRRERLAREAEEAAATEAETQAQAVSGEPDATVPAPTVNEAPTTEETPAASEEADVTEPAKTDEDETTEKVVEVPTENKQVRSSPSRKRNGE